MNNGRFASPKEHREALIANDWRKSGTSSYVWYSQDGRMRWTLFSDHAEKEIMGQGHRWIEAGQIAYELASA